jgi:hypothetical protein
MINIDERRYIWAEEGADSAQWRSGSGERRESLADAVSQGADGGAVGAIVGERPTPLYGDEAGRSQKAEVVRDGGLLDGERLLEVADAHGLALAHEQREELQANRMGEQLQFSGRRLGLGGGEMPKHTTDTARRAVALTTSSAGGRVGPGEGGRISHVRESVRGEGSRMLTGYIYR